MLRVRDLDELAISYLSDEDCLGLRRVSKGLRATVTSRKIWAERALPYNYQLLHLMACNRVGTSILSLIRFCVSLRHTVRTSVIYGTICFKERWIYDVMVHPKDNTQRMSELKTMLVIGRYVTYPSRIANYKIQDFSYFDEEHPFPASKCAHYLSVAKPAVVTYSVSERRLRRSPRAMVMRIDDTCIGTILGDYYNAKPYVKALYSLIPLDITPDWSRENDKDAHTNSCTSMAPPSETCSCIKRFRKRMKQSIRRMKKKGVLPKDYRI